MQRICLGCLWGGASSTLCRLILLPRAGPPEVSTVPGLLWRPRRHRSRQGVARTARPEPRLRCRRARRVVGVEPTEQFPWREAPRDRQVPRRHAMHDHPTAMEAPRAGMGANLAGMGPELVSSGQIGRSSANVGQFRTRIGLTRATGLGPISLSPRANSVQCWSISGQELPKSAEFRRFLGRCLAHVRRSMLVEFGPKLVDPGPSLTDTWPRSAPNWSKSGLLRPTSGALRPMLVEVAPIS